MRRLRTLADIVADMATRFAPAREPEHFELPYLPPQPYRSAALQEAEERMVADLAAGALKASSSDGTGYDPPRLTGAAKVSPDGSYRLLAVDEAADWIPREPPPAVFSKPAPRPAHPDFTERGVELPLGFVPHKLENRTTRLAATATWTPPKAPQAEGFWSEPLPPEHFEAFYLGQVGNSGDGERVRVVEIDRAEGRVRFEPVIEEMPTRRELVKQKQKQRRGKLDPSLRRLQLVAAQRKATK